MAFWLRDYDKRQQQLAAKKQAEVQTKLINEYTEARYNLQKEIGAATGNPEKIAELQQKVKELDDKYKEDMQATADLRQYIEDEADEKAAAAGTLDKYFSTKFIGESEAPNEANLRRQAEMHDKQAGDEQKNAQQNFAIANRAYRGEAEKNAVSQAAMKNALKVANMKGVSAGAAALAREVGDADYNTHMQRQDQQRAEGVKNQREMWGSRQTAEEERANANKERHDYTDAQTYNLASNNLSKGNMFFNDKNAVDTKAKQSPAPEQKVEEHVEEQPAEEETPQDADAFVNAGNLHVLLNYIEGSTKDVDKYNTPEIQALIKKYNVQQLPEANYSYGRQADKVVAERYPEFIADYNRLTGRNIGTEQQIDAKSQADVDKYRQAAELNETQNETQQNIANTLEQNSRYN